MRTVLSILLIAGLQASLHAGDTLQFHPDTIYLEAIHLYEQGAFEESLNTYARIVEGGMESPELYYNMGNAAFRSNKIGHAILYYEKALKMDPAHQDAAHNLEYVSRYRVDAFEEVPEFFLRTWISKAVTTLPEHTWSLLALLSFIVTLGAVLLYLYVRSLALKKTGFFVALVGLIFFLFTLSAGISRYRGVKEPDHGIILSPSVVVRSTPDESGTELFILHEGTRVKVNEQVTGWQNIRVIDGREGWIRLEDLASI